MAQQKRRKGEGHQRPRTRDSIGPNQARVRLSEVRTGRKPVLLSLSSFIGYMAGIWLIMESVKLLNIAPAFGFVWSPAILGVVLILTTALVMDEKGIRSRLKVFDEGTSSRLTYSLAWSALGIITILGIMTWPRY